MHYTKNSRQNMLGKRSFAEEEEEKEVAFGSHTTKRIKREPESSQPSASKLLRSPQPKINDPEMVQFIQWNKNRSLSNSFKTDEEHFADFLSLKRHGALPNLAPAKEREQSLFDRLRSPQQQQQQQPQSQENHPRLRSQARRENQEINGELGLVEEPSELRSMTEESEEVIVSKCQRAVWKLVEKDAQRILQLKIGQLACIRCHRAARIVLNAQGCLLCKTSYWLRAQQGKPSEVDGPRCKNCHRHALVQLNSEEWVNLMTQVGRSHRVATVPGCTSTDPSEEGRAFDCSRGVWN